MKKILLALLGILLLAPPARADEDGIDGAARLVSLSAGEDIAASDPRVARTREKIAEVLRLTGETDDRAVAAACVRLSRHLFDVTKQRVSPLDVLDALAVPTSTGSLQERARRYFDLRSKQKLDHAAALAAMK